MSDAPQGEGWWQASDGRWYAPEQHPNAAAGGAAGATGAAGVGGPGEPGAEPQGQKKGRGKVIAVVVVLLLVGAVAVVAGIAFFGGDDDEAVESGPTTTVDIGDATGELTDDGPIEFDTEYTDALEGDRTEARYTLDAPDGAIMTLRVANEEASERGVLATFEADGERYVSLRVQPGAEESETVILDDTGGREFELIFTEGPAAFSFEVGLEIQDDAGEGGDAGAEFSTAFEVEAGQEVAGLLGGDDDADHFTVELQPGTRLTLDAASDRSSERGVLLTAQLDGERLFSERIQPGADTSLEPLLADGDEGTLELILAEGPGTYTFTADFGELNEGGESGDAPAELSGARRIDVSSALEGAVGGRDEGDYFTFAAPGPSVAVTASSAAESERGYLVSVEDASGSRVASFRVQPGSEASETVEVDPGSEVRLIITEGPASYSISIG